MLAQNIPAGGDTDTIASIADATLGFARLPNHQIERLPDQEMIMRVADRFAEATGPEEEEELRLR